MKDVTIESASEILNEPISKIRLWIKKGLIKHCTAQTGDIVINIENAKNQQKKNERLIINEFKVLKSKKTSPYKTIELFAGAGGTALGMHNAGLQHILLNEIDKDASNTLKKNFSNCKVVNADVKSINFTEYKDKIDVVQAGFPCQAFSYAGKRLGFEEARGTMFFEFARCVKETSPKIAIGENVKGLLNHDGGRTLKTMLQVFDDLGYRVMYRILRAQYLDVPQKRERLIILAIRKDLNMPFVFPKEKDYTISLREALVDCPESEGQQYPKRKFEIMQMVPEGGNWRDLPVALQKEYMRGSFHLGGGKTGMARRLSWDEPSLTLTCAPAQKQTERCHPSETRPLTIREYARIQSFPDDWVFCGSASSQYKQIGNAVPVNLGYHVGRCVVAMLNGEYDYGTMDVVHAQTKGNQLDLDFSN